jgi:hypothetical protein
MDYELAKRLKDAGWPQPAEFEDCPDGQYVWEREPRDSIDRELVLEKAYAPTTDELIEALPRYIPRLGGFAELRIIAGSEHWFAGYEWADYGWQVVTRELTPRIALAELWLTPEVQEAIHLAAKRA